MPPIHQDEVVQEQAYDEFAYDSYPFSQSQPARLAAAAHLLGLTPPDVQTARVLEIGCAAGGNIIPLAAYYPEATFVGIDISGKQIQEGQARIASLGLKNIELRKCSITDIGPDDGLFDYIIAHGVYSWVSPDLGDAVVRVSSQNLSPDGIVYFSYNVYPGWHTKKIVRDLMNFHTEKIVGSAQKIAAARQILATIARHATGSYGAVIAAEQRHLEASDDYYIRHEELSEENNPVYFHEFAAQAARHGLTYLSEADLPVTTLHAYPPTLALQVREVAGDDYIRIQQYLDFFLGRPFRMSLFVKAHRADWVDRIVTPDRVEALHFTYRNTIVQNYPRPELAADRFESDFRLFANDDEAITIENPYMMRVLILLRDTVVSHPGSFSFDELLRHAAGASTPTKVERDAVGKLLLEMIRRKMLWFTTTSIRAVAPGPHPKAFPMVAHDAAIRRGKTTNIQHDRINFLYPASSQFLELLDGTRTLEEIESKVFELVNAGKMKLESTLEPFDRMTNVREATHLYVIRSLEHMGRLKLLEA